MFGFIRSIFSDSSGPMIDTTPSVNIDGTPMIGNVDIHGNPFGITSDDTFSCSTMFDDSPGCGSNMFDDAFNNCDNSMFDDTLSNCSSMFDD
jgi:hypothetical protein